MKKSNFRAEQLLDFDQLLLDFGQLLLLFESKAEVKVMQRDVLK